MANLNIDFSQYEQKIVPSGSAVACRVSLVLPYEGRQGVKFPSFAWKGKDGKENAAFKVVVISPEYKGASFWVWRPVFSPEKKDEWKIEKTRKLYAALAAYRGERTCIEKLNVEAVCVLSVWETKDGEEQNGIERVLAPEEELAQTILAKAHGLAIDFEETPEEFF